MNDLITVNFHRQSIFALEQNGKRWVAMKPIVEAIGLDWVSQHKRLQRDPVLSSTMVIMTIVAADGKQREMLFLELDYLNGWLFGIDANRVKPELRERVIDYQRECYKVLADHFSQKKDYAFQKLEAKVYKSERAYFERYPDRRQMRDLALVGEPYWFIGRIVGRAAGTVSNAIKHMLKWGMMDARALTIARYGMTSWWRHRRKYANQLPLGI